MIFSHSQIFLLDFHNYQNSKEKQVLKYCQDSLYKTMGHGDRSLQVYLVPWQPSPPLSYPAPQGCFLLLSIRPSTSLSYMHVPQEDDPSSIYCPVLLFWMFISHISFFHTVDEHFGWVDDLGAMNNTTTNLGGQVFKKRKSCVFVSFLHCSFISSCCGKQYY